MTPTGKNYKWVAVPSEVLRSDKLSLLDKVLFMEISCLDAGLGCFASNQYFADFCHLHPRRISDHLAALKNKGFITMTLKHHNQRIIRVARKYVRRGGNGSNFIS